MKARIQIKHDTPANWDKAKNFIPLPGEIIIYDGVIEAGVYIEQPKLKVGDGVHTVVELPFMESNKKLKNYSYENETLKIN